MTTKTKQTKTPTTKTTITETTTTKTTSLLFESFDGRHQLSRLLITSPCKEIDNREIGEAHIAN